MRVLLVIFIVISFTPVFGDEQIEQTEQTVETDYTPVPLLTALDNIGWNALHSITCNYGLNFIGAGLGTFIFIETGLDWKWNRVAYNNSWMPKVGEYTNYFGYAVPVLTPVALYLIGRAVKDEKLQITGLALTQSLALTVCIQTPLKVITGRASPGIVDGWDSLSSRRSDRTDDYSREFNWFKLEIIGGWPSGHSAHAFAAAATISQIYHDNLLLKIAVHSYALLISLGMSVYDHWASEIIAGALMGYAIGTTVGKNFRNLIEKTEKPLTFYITTNSIGVIIKM